MDCRVAHRVCQAADGGASRADDCSHIRGVGVPFAELFLPDFYRKGGALALQVAEDIYGPGTVTGRNRPVGDTPGGRYGRRPVTGESVTAVKNREMGARRRDGYFSRDYVFFDAIARGKPLFT